MEYVYILLDGKQSILTPGVSSVSEIRNEILHQDPETIITRSTYPNGFVIEMETHAGSITCRCNQPLVDNGDGTLTAPTDK